MKHTMSTGTRNRCKSRSFIDAMFTQLRLGPMFRHEAVVWDGSIVQAITPWRDSSWRWDARWPSTSSPTTSPPACSSSSPGSASSCRPRASPAAWPSSSPSSSASSTSSTASPARSPKLTGWQQSRLSSSSASSSCSELSWVNINS